MTGDGMIDAHDTTAFVLALTNRNAYSLAYFNIDVDYTGDIDGSSTFDLGALSALLSGPASKKLCRNRVHGS